MDDRGAAPRVTFGALSDFIATALTRIGMPEGDARTTGALMAEADLQGSDGHGAIRLVPYAKRIRAGGINLAPNIRVVAERMSDFGNQRRQVRRRNERVRP